MITQADQRTELAIIPSIHRCFLRSIFLQHPEPDMITKAIGRLSSRAIGIVVIGLFPLYSSCMTVPTSDIGTKITAAAATETPNDSPVFSQPSTNTPQTKKNVATAAEYGGDKEGLLYKSGIPTLRSSAHRVKFDVKRRNHDPKPRDRTGCETKTTWLPSALLREHVFDYDVEQYNLPQAVMNLLHSCDESIVGTFEEHADGSELRLEDFRVPPRSIWRKVNGGSCEDSQKNLSDAVASNTEFLKCFERFVDEVALTYFKKRLVATGAVDPDAPTTFYYQYPPTMRLQPGPAWAKVKPHNDAEYGHQNGELNFWVPLTDRKITNVDLWSETTHQQDDYHPIPAKIGQAIAFHGSSCRHFVNANETCNTRVSLDFRIGVQGFFDPYWQMKGTTDDHGRREVTI
jgi:hypothetical protein